MRVRGLWRPYPMSLWPWWMDIILGGLGLAWAISIFGQPPKSRSDLINRWGLLVFSLLLVAVGTVRWLGL